MGSKKYKTVLRRLKKEFFFDPRGRNIQLLLDFLKQALDNLVAHQGSGPLFPTAPEGKVRSQLKREAHMQLTLGDQCVILNSLNKCMQGSVKANSPYMVKNIIPTPALMHLVTNLAVSIYMPNGVTGEDAAEVLNAEIACVGILEKMVGLDEDSAAGVFTFGGTGTNLYAHKIGLMKALPNHGLDGIRQDVMVIGSRSSHYSHQTVSNWLGIGQNNYIQVGAHVDQTTRLDELEAACCAALIAGKRIACIEAAGGTTSNMAIDNVRDIYDIRERLVSQFGLEYRPHIHVDSVLGWAYLNFINYDFCDNPMGFSDTVLLKIAKIVARLKTFKFADSFGVDFHKTGYMPYISSMIIVNKKEDFSLLRRDRQIMTPLFHDESAYNPGVFTLETSRSAANILATFLTLQAFGNEGYQALLGHTLEISEYLREEFAKHEDVGFYVANRDSFGCDIFIRCYPRGIHPARTYELELRDDAQLQMNTDYTNGFARWLFANKSCGDDGIALSKTSAAFYTHTGRSMVALRIYPLNPYITRSTVRSLVRRMVRAKLEFDADY